MTAIVVVLHAAAMRSLKSKKKCIGPGIFLNGASDSLMMEADFRAAPWPMKHNYGYAGNTIRFFDAMLPNFLYCLLF
jgi:hypothetical protein